MDPFNDPQTNPCSNPNDLDPPSTLYIPKCPLAWSLCKFLQATRCSQAELWDKMDRDRVWSHCFIITLLILVLELLLLFLLVLLLVLFLFLLLFLLLLLWQKPGAPLVCMFGPPVQSCACGRGLRESGRSIEGSTACRPAAEYLTLAGHEMKRNTLKLPPVNDAPKRTGDEFALQLPYSNWSSVRHRGI